MTDLDLLHKHLLPQIAPKGAKKMENLFYEKNLHLPSSKWRREKKFRNLKIFIENLKI